MSDSHDSAAREPDPGLAEGGTVPPPSHAAGRGPGPAESAGDPALAFLPAGVRYRYDGWTPDRQIAFIERLAECGCVEEAVRAVGMSRNSAYALRRRGDAQAFRLAWEAAQDAAIARLNDAALARAINGVAVPIFHGGEQVGVRRHYDERLTMFLLRYRDPVRYGRWRDRMEASQHEDGPASVFGFRLGRMMRAAWNALRAALDGQDPPEPEWEPVMPASHIEAAAEAAAARAAEDEDSPPDGTDPEVPPPGDMRGRV